MERVKFFARGFGLVRRLIHWWYLWVWLVNSVAVDSGGCMKLGPGLSFSWKRALGVSKAKRRVSKKTGIPLTRGGRRMKLGKWMGMK